MAKQEQYEEVMEADTPSPTLFPLITSPLKRKQDSQSVLWQQDALDSDVDSIKNLKLLRESVGISQARLAEITGIPQHVISAYELRKSEPSAKHLQKLHSVLSNPDSYQSILGRKKRYQQHSYELQQRCDEREKKCQKTEGNSAYIQSINSLMDKPTPIFKALSLFSGIGGFSLGFQSSGFDICGFVEIEDKLSEIYKLNFPNTPRIGSDITKVSAYQIEQLLSEHGQIDAIIGGPPCQGFSLSGNRDINDPRNYLFQDYLRIISLIKPKVAILENVRLLTSMRNNEGVLIKKEIEAGFFELGYKTKIFEINATQYGVPQHRERVLFVAFRNDLNIEPSLPPFSHGIGKDILFQKPRTFADACSDLKYLESGDTSDDVCHAAVKHPDHVIKWLWNVPEGASAHDNDDPALRPPSGYNTTYKRQIWLEPASTVQTTFGMISGCRNVHPIATRSLTIREAARLQSFPDSYKFCGSAGAIRTGIGNAVPPLLAASVANHIRSILTNFVEVSSF